MTIPAKCVHGHDLTKEGAARIRECRHTGRQRYRCVACEREYKRASRARKTLREKVMEDAIDEETLERVKAIASQLRDITAADIIRLTIEHTIDQLEERVRQNTAAKRGSSKE